jgi:hypothetical protein
MKAQHIYTVDSKLTPVKQVGHHLTLNSKIINVMQRNVPKISNIRSRFNYS